MKIKYITPLIVIVLLIQVIPAGESLTINPLGRDIIVYPTLNTNNESLVFLYHSTLGYYKTDTFYNGTEFNNIETTSYVNKTSMRYATHSIYSLADFNQTITVKYPDTYSYTIYNEIVGYNLEEFDSYFYVKITSDFSFPTDSVINQTGIYVFNITTKVLTPSLTYIYNYKELNLNVTELIGSYEDINNDELPIISINSNFIGTLAGFICMFSLFAVPMVCAYKIKHTGEKLKWSVYGFILICIIFFCMIAFFQMG